MAAEVVRWYPPGDGLGVLLDAEWNALGRLAPPPKIARASRPFGSGSVVTAVTYGERVLTQSLYVLADEASLPDAIRDIAYALDPQRGVGTLSVTRPDSTARHLYCRVLGGLEGRELLGDDAGFEWQRFEVQFLAVDPFWYSTIETSQTVASGTGAASADDEVTTTSDVQEGTWPILEVDGPATAAYFTLGSLSFAVTSLALSSGQTLTVDTRPGEKTVTKTGDVNMWPHATGHMWPLAIGTNTVHVEVVGAGSATRVRCRYRHRYLTC